MLRFWMVMRYKDTDVARHPHHGERNVYYLNESGRRGEINYVMWPSLEAAEANAASLAQQNPAETIMVLEQKAVFELPSLPAPIKKKFNTRGELVPDA